VAKQTIELDEFLATYQQAVSLIALSSSLTRPADGDHHRRDGATRAQNKPDLLTETSISELIFLRSRPDREQTRVAEGGVLLLVARSTFIHRLSFRDYQFAESRWIREDTPLQGAG
jgi:hypothetical protein